MKNNDWSYKQEGDKFYIINHFGEYHGRVANKDTAIFFSNAMNENTCLKNQMRALESELVELREALETIKYHSKDTPSDFDISIIQNTADKAMEDK